MWFLRRSGNVKQSFDASVPRQSLGTSVKVCALALVLADWFDKHLAKK